MRCVAITWREPRIKKITLIWQTDQQRLFPYSWRGTARMRFGDGQSTVNRINLIRVENWKKKQTRKQPGFSICDDNIDHFQFRPQYVVAQTWFPNVKVSDYVVISPSLAGTFIPQTFNFLYFPLLVSILFVCKVKFALSFMKHGFAPRTQSHRPTQAWVNSGPAAFIFSSSPLLLCVPPTEWWKVNSEMMDRRPAEHRWRDRCREQGCRAWLSTTFIGNEGKKNQTVKIFLFLFHCCSAVAMSESGGVAPEAGTRAPSRVTVKNRPAHAKMILSKLQTPVRLSFPRTSFFSSLLLSVYLSSFGDWINGSGKDNITAILPSESVEIVTAAGFIGVHWK